MGSFPGSFFAGATIEHELGKHQRDAIAARYQRAVEAGIAPSVRAFIKLDPDGKWTVFVGSKYNPQSNLRYQFDRDRFEAAHEFARNRVAWKMLGALKRLHALQAARL